LPLFCRSSSGHIGKLLVSSSGVSAVVLQPEAPLLQPGNDGRERSDASTAPSAAQHRETLTEGFTVPEVRTWVASQWAPLVVPAVRHTVIIVCCGGRRLRPW
jgi:hypothetical protein